ncbi:MAG: cell surface protein SprA [Bacteroidia bacterium]|nr:cell surface protein SprA [Bacteroidia bacterium]
MGVKNLSVNYSQTDGSILPGYMNRTQLFGMNGDLSPGIPYILGYTENDFGIHAGENGWLTNSEDLYEPFTLNHKEDWNIRSSVEPVTGMRIDVSATQSKMMNRTEYIQYDPVEEEWEAQNTIENGNFSMSFNTIGSAFERITSQKNYSSETFKTFNENRRIISERMALQRLESGNQNYGEVNPSGLDSAGYRQGYSGTSQDVLIPAFIAAYTGQTPQEVDLDMMPEMVSFKNKKLRLNIMPNWRITYDGLKNIKLLKKYLKTITVSHAYRCTYSVGNFSSNSTYMSLIQHKRPDSLNLVYDAENNFLPMYDVGSVSINEQFNPLIDIDMTWINSLITKIEIKRTRNIAFSLSNNWMTETSGNDYTLGTGYRIKSVPILINKKKFESDINLRADFSLRKTLTVIRKLQEEIDEITSGQNAYSVKLSADYVLNERFNIKIFYDWTGTRPKMSLTFPRYNTSFGISLRFTLTQL